MAKKRTKKKRAARAERDEVVLTNKPGRPPKPKEKVLITIATRVSPRVLAALKKQAKKDGVDLSRYIRQLCRKEVKSVNE